MLLAAKAAGYWRSHQRCPWDPSQHTQAQPNPLLPQSSLLCQSKQTTTLHPQLNPSANSVDTANSITTTLPPMQAWKYHLERKYQRQDSQSALPLCTYKTRSTNTSCRLPRPLSYPQCNIKLSQDNEKVMWKLCGFSVIFTALTVNTSYTDFSCLLLLF